MIYLQLFLSFLQVGMFSIGGGYAAMPLIQKQVAETHTWLTMSEFTDLITIAEMTPGPIAVNSATFVGIRIAGIPGAVIATLGCILPSCFIVSLLAYIYYRYRGVSTLQNVLSSLRPAVVALIAAAGLSILQLVLLQGKNPMDFFLTGENSIGLTDINWIGGGLFLAAFVTLRKLKWNPILVMALCGAAGLGLNLLI
ncbi:MAG: chromate transporter [Lachnospiraceae bacterium]|nr:chromate transporter [Lachnospiraceae bacterium]